LILKTKESYISNIIINKVVSRIFFPKLPNPENRLFSDAVKKSVPF
jgi:hypothetical protein